MAAANFPFYSHRFFIIVMSPSWSFIRLDSFMNQMRQVRDKANFNHAHGGKFATRTNRKVRSRNATNLRAGDGKGEIVKPRDSFIRRTESDIKFQWNSFPTLQVRGRSKERKKKEERGMQSAKRVAEKDVKIAPARPQHRNLRSPKLYPPLNLQFPSRRGDQVKTPYLPFGGNGSIIAAESRKRSIFLDSARLQNSWKLVNSWCIPLRRFVSVW